MGLGLGMGLRSLWLGMGHSDVGWGLDRWTWMPGGLHPTLRLLRLAVSELEDGVSTLTPTRTPTT